MYALRYQLQEFLDDKQIAALTKLGKEKTFFAPPDWTDYQVGVADICCMTAMLRLENKDDFIPPIIKVQKPRRQLTHEEAENTSLMERLFTPFGELASAPNDATRQKGLHIVEIKRGKSFIEKFLKERGWALNIALTEYCAHPNTKNATAVYQKPGTTEVYVITTMLDYYTTCRVYSLIPIIFKDFLKLKEGSAILNYFAGLAKVPKDYAAPNNHGDTALRDFGRPLVMELFNRVIKPSEWFQNIENELLKQEFKSFIEHQHQKLEDRVNEATKRYEASIEQMQALYADLLNAQKDAMFYTPSVAIDDILRYLRNNRYIADLKINGQYMLIAIEAPLEVDEKGLKKLCANPNSYIYPQLNSYEFPQHVLAHKEAFNDFLKAIFLGQRYRLYARAEFALDTDRNDLNSLWYECKNSTSLWNRVRGFVPHSWSVCERLKTNKCIIPHVHIAYYNCWSGNRANAQKALQKQDLITCVETLIATVKDLNIFDSTVFSRFIRNSLAHPYDAQNIVGQRNIYGEDQIIMDSGDSYKTIYDKETKEWRTFNDVFLKDFVGTQLTQEDLAEEDLLKYID